VGITPRRRRVPRPRPAERAPRDRSAISSGIGITPPVRPKKRPGRALGDDAAHVLDHLAGVHLDHQQRVDALGEARAARPRGRATA
jgi:hypothetical protein